MPDYLHLASALAIHPDTGQVLLGKNVGHWWLPGGRAEVGETFAEAAVRETLEETNVHVEPIGVISMVERTKRGVHEVFVVVRVRYVAGEPAAVDPDGKVTEVGWFDLDVAERLADRHHDRLARLAAQAPAPLRRGPSIV